MVGAVLITSVLKIARRSFSIVALNVFRVKSLRLHSKQYLCFSLLQLLLLLLPLPLLLLVVVFVELAVVVPPPPPPWLLCFSSFVGIFLLQFPNSRQFVSLKFLFFSLPFLLHTHLSFISFAIAINTRRNLYWYGIHREIHLYIYYYIFAHTTHTISRR